LPPDNLVDAKINMFWDGIFHAAVWLMTVLGAATLFAAGRRADVPWCARLLLGGGLLGWGLFNLSEGLIDHHLLRLHHVVDALPQPWTADLAFLAWGLLMALLGLALIRHKRAGQFSSAWPERAKHAASPPGRAEH
jgi:uncharacterized membrane protein